VVSFGELDRLRETIEVLSDPEAVAALADTEPVVFGIDAIKALVAERVACETRRDPASRHRSRRRAPS
jgi:putative hemolysin